MLQYRGALLFMAALMAAAMIVNVGLSLLFIAVDVFAQLWN